MQRSTSLDISGMQKQKSIESFSDRTLKTEKKDRFKHNELVPGVDVARTSSSLYDSGYYSECEVLRPSKSSEIYANSDEKFAIKSIEVDPSSTNQRRESTIGDNTKKSCANLDQISSTSCIFSTFQDIESQLEDKSLNNESNKNTFTLRPMVTDSGFNVSPSHLEYDFESLLHPHGNKLHSGSSASTSTTSTDCSTCTTQTVEDVSSSMENINLIDGEAWDLLSNSIPTVSFQDDTPEFQFSSDDSISSDPDEFSRYISPTTPLFPDVPQDELDCLDPVFLYENTRFVSFEMNKGPKSSRNTTTKHGKEQTSFIRSFYTQTLKEELKSKILLRRFDAGQEELETGSPEPKPTISYDAVKKRHAIREKNKLYAKESRDRAHIKRQELELSSNKLKKEKTAKITAQKPPTPSTRRQAEKDRDTTRAGLHREIAQEATEAPFEQVFAEKQQQQQRTKLEKSSLDPKAGRLQSGHVFQLLVLMISSDVNRSKRVDNCSYQTSQEILKCTLTISTSAQILFRLDLNVIKYRPTS